MVVDLNIDTQKIKKAGVEIIELSFEAIEIINSFYTRINNIPTKTREWVGKESEYYSYLCLNEKEQYIKFLNSLKSLGESLITYSNDLEGRANSVEGELCQK